MTLPPRRLVRLKGADALPFLQGLLTNDVLRLKTGPGIVYAALLTPQGKYLADFFVLNRGDALYLDLPESLAEGVLRRLGLYRLRADVAFDPTDLGVFCGHGPAPEGALMDPRHPALGWRLYGSASGDDGSDWTALRVRHLIPETGIELVPEESYILECGFERLNGVDFRKGCYVGQEVTARMKHKTELRKGLARVTLSAAVPVGTEIVLGEKVIGRVLSQAGQEAIAWLRLDQAGPGMHATGIAVSIASTQG